MKVSFGYTGIRVKNLEESVEFYTRVLGMKEVGRFTQATTHGEVVLLAMDGSGHLLELNFYPAGNQFETTYHVGEGLDHLGFEVTDLDAVLAEAQKAGYAAHLVLEDAAHRWAYILDPNSIWVEFFVAPN
jgi:catechol 2,3-dioxygenase-like lactoylglutathione lyase family enzyme